MRPCCASSHLASGRPFLIKSLNIVDPLLPNNNIGRSVSKGNAVRIISALRKGARDLEVLLLTPPSPSLATFGLSPGVSKFFDFTLRSLRSQLDANPSPFVLASPLAFPNSPVIGSPMSLLSLTDSEDEGSRLSQSSGLSRSFDRSYASVLRVALDRRERDRRTVYERAYDVTMISGGEDVFQTDEKKLWESINKVREMLCSRHPPR